MTNTIQTNASFALPHARDTETAPKTYECRIRLSPEGVGIVSPRTGRVLYVPCDTAPVRTRQRIVHARSTCQPTLTFTVAELQAFAVAAQPRVPAIAKAPVSIARPAVPVPLHGGWHRPRGRRAR